MKRSLIAISALSTTLDGRDVKQSRKWHKSVQKMVIDLVSTWVDNIRFPECRKGLPTSLIILDSYLAIIKQFYNVDDFLFKGRNFIIC